MAKIKIDQFVPNSYPPRHIGLAPAAFLFTHHGEQTPHLDFDLQRVPNIDGHLFHYTNLMGLSGIIESGEIWLSKIGFSNDFLEVGYPAQLLQDCIQCCESVKHEIVQQALKVFRQALETSRGDRCYSASFSKNGNLLSQWRGYAAGGGVALGIKTERMVEIVKGTPFDLVVSRLWTH